MAKPMKAKKNRKKGKRKKKGPEPGLDPIAQRLAGLTRPNPANALKKPKDFLVRKYFTVEEVVSQSYETSIDRNNVFGSPPNIKKTGYKIGIVLAVRPTKDNPDIIVRELRFNGDSVVKVGNEVAALIPKYEQKRHPLGLDKCVHPSRRSNVEYVDRDFKRSEEAIELVIQTHAGGTVRTDRAIDYPVYMGQDR
jgi:hypothetical protein